MKNLVYFRVDVKLKVVKSNSNKFGPTKEYNDYILFKKQFRH